MWAMLDYDGETVIAVFPPDSDQEAMVVEADGRTLIEMTLENSPGWISGKYRDGKFYPPENNNA